MSYQEARRRLLASSAFTLRDGRVWLREMRWLRAVEDLRREEAAAEQRCVGDRWRPASAAARG